MVLLPSMKGIFIKSSSSRLEVPHSHAHLHLLLFFLLLSFFSHLLTPSILPPGCSQFMKPLVAAGCLLFSIFLSLHGTSTSSGICSFLSLTNSFICSSFLFLHSMSSLHCSVTVNLLVLSITNSMLRHRCRRFAPLQVASLSAADCPHLTESLNTVWPITMSSAAPSMTQMGWE